MARRVTTLDLPVGAWAPPPPAGAPAVVTADWLRRSRALAPVSKRAARELPRCAHMQNCSANPELPGVEKAKIRSGKSPSLQVVVKIARENRLKRH